MTIKERKVGVQRTARRGKGGLRFMYVRILETKGIRSSLVWGHGRSLRRGLN